MHESDDSTKSANTLAHTDIECGEETSKSTNEAASDNDLVDVSKNSGNPRAFRHLGGTRRHFFRAVYDPSGTDPDLWARADKFASKLQDICSNRRRRPIIGKVGTSHTKGESAFDTCMNYYDADMKLTAEKTEKWFCYFRVEEGFTEDEMKFRTVYTQAEYENAAPYDKIPPAFDLIDREGFAAKVKKWEDYTLADVKDPPEALVPDCWIWPLNRPETHKPVTMEPIKSKF